MTTKTARIGDYEITLAPPASYAVRSEIIRAQGSNYVRAIIAALGACWRDAKYVGSADKPPPKPRLPGNVTYSSSDYNPLLYGGRVLDALEAQGLDMGAVYAAGNAAIELIGETLITQKEVDDTTDFSEAEGEAPVES